MKKSWFVVAAAVPLVVVGSIAVWQLSGSDGRRVGALQPLEASVPLSWRGAWSDTGGYKAGEVVSFGGATFVAQRDNSATKPDPWCEDDCMWAALASQGPKGDPGPTGPAGPGGPAGGDLVGTFPNATIKAGAVGANEIADGSLKAVDAFALSGTVSVDPPSIAANSCVELVISVPGRQSGDLPILFPTRNFGASLGRTLTLVPHTATGTDTVDRIHATACNVGSSAEDAAAGAWRYVLIRP